MFIREIMHTGLRNAVVKSTDCFRDVLEELNRKSLGAVCVVDGTTLMGIITDGDVRRLVLSTQKPLAHLFMTSASEIIVKNPKTIGADTTLDECLALLEQYQFWVIPVVDQQKNLLGMVHMHALLKAMVEQSKKPKNV